MDATRCTVDHQALKLDISRWIMLDYVGTQHIDADDSGPAEDLELRNCTCGTTLAVKVR